MARGAPSRRFRDFRYRTLGSWSRSRRVVGKAEWLPGARGANPRFVVTSLTKDRFAARALYEKLYCARGDMENRIKEQQLDLFADRTSTATMRANQLRLYFSAFAGILLLIIRRFGLAEDLKRALATYTESGGTGRTAVDKDEAVRVMLEKYEICLGLFHGFDWSKWTTGTPPERLGLLPAAQEHILAQENGKERCVTAVRELNQVFALSVPHEETVRIRDDLSFFLHVQSVLAKRAPGEVRREEDLDQAVRQIVSRAVASEGIIDIFAAAGLEKPDISILSDEFLDEVKGMPQRNLAVELLQKLLKGEVATRRRKNVVQARSFTEMLEQTLRRYQTRTITAAQVIEELISLARELREAGARGEALGLTDDELAFYDALETNDSAVQVLGDEILRDIARELVEAVRRNVKIDWTMREDVRANLRRLVKRILRKYGYPPDKQEKATQTVLEQAEQLSTDWATEQG